MPRVRVYEIDGQTFVIPRLRALSVTGTGTIAILTPRLRIERITGSGTVPTRPRLRVLRVVAAGVVSLVLNALTNRSGIEPETLVQITASVDVGVPDTWTWRQISGPVVTLVGSGPTVSFTAPSSMTAVTVVLGVTAASASVVSAERQVTVQVLPQTLWNYISGVWRGARPSTWI